MDQASLHERAERLTALAADWPDLRDRARDLLARTETGEFRVAVVGEFKRGKSTLLNALLDREVLPTGVLPVTAVPIEIAAGDDDAVVQFKDGRRQQIGLGELGRFTTESDNPGNRLGVAKAEVRVRGQLLEHGLTLVDVPGMGSVHDNATATALGTYEKVDGAVLVLSADSPLSADERRVARELQMRGARVFVVINRCDRLDLTELAEVRQFVARELEWPTNAVYCLSAREAFRHRFEMAGDFFTFLGALKRFVADDLIETRNDLISREIAMIGTAIGERATLELLAGDLDMDELKTKVQTFETALSREEARHDSDRRAMTGEVAALGALVRSRLLQDARTSFDARQRDLLRGLPSQGSLDAMRQQVLRDVESIVRDEYSQIWTSEAAWLNGQWVALAEHHRDETEARLGAVRAAAAELFSAELSSGRTPSLGRDEDENLYYFPPSFSIADGVLDPLRRLTPASWFRDRIAKSAQLLLYRAVAKHAGRAGAALDERLDRSWRAFDHAMERYLEEVVAGISGALDRVSRSREEAETTVRDRRAQLERVIVAVADLETSR